MEPVEIKVRPRYWDRTTAIQYAAPGAINTIPAESDLYNKEEIFKFIRRSADKVWVVNDGADSLYVRYATEGVESFSDENVIFPKEYKVYYNVFELHLRSPTAGLPYRVSEFEIMPCCTSGGGGGDVVVTNVPLPVDLTDDCTRLLGQICAAGGPIDPRAIRALSSLIDSVDISDRCNRSLGQLCFGGIPIDPRAIRNLSSVTDSVTVTGTVASTIAALTPIQKALQHNVSLPSPAGSDLLGAALVPTNTPCTFRITIAVSITGILTLDRINGAVEVRTFLNGGISLNERVEYTWDVQVYAGDTINLEYSVTGGTVMILRVAEIDAAIASN